MATTRFRFDPEPAAQLGISAGMAPDELTKRLGFPEGAKVTSAKADGDGVVLNVSGATLADGTEVSGGEVTGSFVIGKRGAITFDGFRLVDADEPAADEPAATTAPTQEG